MPPTPNSGLARTAARGASKVFVSSTVEDLEPLRNQVRDVAASRAQTFCWLSDYSGSNERAH